MTLKQLLGLDYLHWMFLFFGFVVAGLVFMIWYPELVGAVGWERGEYITIDSLVAQAIGSLIVSLILWILYVLGFWLLLRKSAGSKKAYGKDKAAVVAGIVWLVNFFILPKVVAALNFLLRWLINIGIGILLLAAPLAAFLLTMQLLRYVASRRQFTVKN